MKTMLDDRYSDQIPAEDRWTPEMMLARYEGKVVGSAQRRLRSHAFPAPQA